MSNTILVSGCGITFPGERKTWVTVAKSIGLKIIDMSGPAISNQSIINSIITTILENNQITDVICQLTTIGKLDVEINESRLETLVQKDSLRNFVHKNMWPSSHSREHSSKELYYQWLYSPTLEIITLSNQIIMLDSFCNQRGINLSVVQGYKINWAVAPSVLKLTCFTDDFIIYDDYKASEAYKEHDYSNQNTVPNVKYQAQLASKILSKAKINFDRVKLDKVLKHYGIN